MLNSDEVWLTALLTGVGIVNNGLKEIVNGFLLHGINIDLLQEMALDDDLSWFKESYIVQGLSTGDCYKLMKFIKGLLFWGFLSNSMSIAKNEATRNNDIKISENFAVKFEEKISIRKSQEAMMKVLNDNQDKQQKLSHASTMGFVKFDNAL